MNRQQKYLLGMLKEIHAICEKNNITYFIGMGTLIGAVRNGGFLPWDDDADIIITRQEWERFKIACETDLPPNRFLGAASLQADYGNSLPRYMASDTTCIHTCQSLHDEVSGEIIDFFILDPISDEPGEYEAYVQDVLLYSAVVNYANIVGARLNLDAEVFKHYKQMEKEQGRLAVITELEERLASHCSESGSRYGFCWQGVPVHFQRSWFAKAVPIAFEDTTLMAPCGINEFLTSYYGEEWVQIPARINPSKHNTAYSLDFPYTEALTYFKPSVDREKLREDVVKRQYEVLAYSPENNALRDIEAQAQLDAVGLELHRVIEQNHQELERAIENNDVSALRALLDGYISAQVSPEAVGRHFPGTYYRYVRPILIDASDSAFEGALLCLLGEGNMRYVARMLEVRKEKGLALTERMQLIERIVAEFNAAANSYHHGDCAACCAQTESLLGINICSENAEILQLSCASLAKLWQQTQNPQDEQRMLERLKRCRELFPADGVFAKLWADHLDACGNSSEARKLYLRAAESTRNGLTLKAIAEKTGYHPRCLREPKWSHAAGVPRWDEEEPKPLDVKKTHGPKPSDFGWKAPQEYLLELLEEITSAFEKMGAPCILVPDAAFAVAKRNCAPDLLDAFAVVAKADDVLKFVEELEAHMPPSRSLKYADASQLAAVGEVKYCATDSTCTSLKKGVRTDDHLHVRILPVMHPRNPQAVEGAWRYWKGDELAGEAQSSETLKIIKRLGIAKEDEASGKKLLAHLLKKRLLKGAAVLDLGDGLKPFNEALLDNQQRVELSGFAFNVPANMQAYAKLASKKKFDNGLELPPSSLTSVMVSPAEIAEHGIVPEGLPARYRANAKAKSKSAATLRKFKKNFNEIKFAVRLKPVADELLIHKDDIMQCAAQGDLDAVRPLFAKYLKLSKLPAGKNMIDFDPDLYKILNRLK